MRLRFCLAIALAGALLGACVETQRPEASGKGNVRGIHAMPSAAEAVFNIEERSLGNLTYKASTTAQPFDDLIYDFHFAVRLPGSSAPERIVSRTVDVVADTDYVFALTGTTGSPSILLWETDIRQWDNETVFEASVGHLAAATDAVDVYFAPRGTAPATGNARGTLAFGERLPPFDAEEGEFELILTQAGDPAAVLFTSPPREFNAQTSVLFVIQEADPSITSAISVRRMEQGGNAVEVGDINAAPTRRFFNAAFGSGAFDVYVEDDFANPLVSDLPYGSVSADVTVPAGQSTFTFTAAGNTGAVLVEDEETVIASTRGTNFVTGEAGDDLDVARFSDDRRPIAEFGKMRIVQASANFELVDIYLLAPGTSIDDASPGIARLASNSSSGYLHFNPGNFELTVTEANEKDVVAGPIPLALPAGSIVETAIIDTEDPNVVEVVQY